MQDDSHITTDPARLQALLRSRLQIEYLRRGYALATDQLGLVEDAEAQANGLRIYHRIFAPDADVRVTRDGATLLSACGPDGWGEVARNALRDYAATQHLIGTQLVSFDQIEFAAETAEITAGTADMSSYLQATHVWPDRRMRLVLGTYVDRVRWMADSGWQIVDMTLVYTSEEFRQLDTTA